MILMGLSMAFMTLSGGCQYSRGEDHRHRAMDAFGGHPCLPVHIPGYGYYIRGVRQTYGDAHRVDGVRVQRGDAAAGVAGEHMARRSVLGRSAGVLGHAGIAAAHRAWLDGGVSGKPESGRADLPLLATPNRGAASVDAEQRLYRSIAGDGHVLVRDDSFRRHHARQRVLGDNDHAVRDQAADSSGGYARRVRPGRLWFASTKSQAGRRRSGQRRSRVSPPSPSFEGAGYSLPHRGEGIFQKEWQTCDLELSGRYRGTLVRRWRDVTGRR